MKGFCELMALPHPQAGELAQKDSKEQDPVKLLDFVNAFCDRLDQTSDRNPCKITPEPGTKAATRAV